MTAWIATGALALAIAATPAQAACDDASYMLSTDEASPSTVLTVAAINAILKEHNDARRAVSPAPETMPMLQWDQKLADLAQGYMDTCPGLKHNGDRKADGYTYVGENLAAGSSSKYGVDEGGGKSTAAWNAELSEWTYPKTCTGVCGHYTQVVWAKTTHVGCGYKYCASETYKNYWACNYGPGGNYNGEAPWVEATTTVAECHNTATTTAGPTTTPTATTTEASSVDSSESNAASIGVLMASLLGALATLA